MITDFIQQATSELGINEEQASTGVGGILNMLKDNADGGDFSSLLGAIPGADNLMEGASSAVGGASSGGGLGGMLGGLAGGMFGGGLGDMIEDLVGVSSLLSATGLDMSQLGGLATRFFDFAKSEAGEGIVDKLLEAAPAEIRGLLS